MLFFLVIHGFIIIPTCLINSFVHTYHSRFIPEGVAESFHISFYQNYLAIRNTADVTGGKPIAI
jgi:hypothetical protein